MITELQTPRMLLRRVNVADTKDLFAIWSDPDVTRFMNISSFTQEAQAKEMIELLENLALEKKAVRFSMIEQSSGQLIGSCGFNRIDFENEKAEIGYDVAKAYWGKGFAPESIQALVCYAFDTLGLHRLEAKVEPDNRNSLKVLQKLGFTYEGTLRHYEKSKEQFVDITMHSLLQTDDWKAC